MPDLPVLEPINHCPDPSCRAAIGFRHNRDCNLALCVTDGVQRTPHLTDPPGDDHDCGAAVWTGYPAGAVEAAAAGLFTRHATPTDAPLTGWIPCTPGHPDARPDLHRVITSGRWNPDRQVFELTGVTDRG